MMVYRFAVGEPGLRSSHHWKLWAHNDDAYLLTRSTGRFHKFSFHRSGICRWAEVRPRDDGRDRCMLKWSRDPVPPAGQSGVALLVSLIFPTNHLSTRSDGDPRISWILPAPVDSATVVEIGLTAERAEDVARICLQSGVRELLHFQSLRRQDHLIATRRVVECGPVELKAPGDPGVPGQLFGDMVFPNKDHANTGRPIRMILFARDQVPPVIWELGGYEPEKRLIGSGRE
ncbi:MAG: hypothetical protein K2X74_08850 [Acetobacteraceae bacterium]|nr:hypothetical protein [Acetobacteraceae bacterium]